MIVPTPLKPNASARVKNARERFITVHGAKLFNLLPYNLRNENSGDYTLFKNNLDVFLTTIPDQPTVAGMGRSASSNSLVDQIPLVLMDEHTAPLQFYCNIVSRTTIVEFALSFDIKIEI